MNINRIKKLRKIVRIKKLGTKNNKIFVCTMKKTSVRYRMVLTIIPCLFYSFAPFPKQSTDDYLSDHLHGQEVRKVFIQHPRYNIEVFLKRTKVGRAIIHSHWPKVART